jgi:tetratricopeptide (TPR) repeat protein
MMWLSKKNITSAAIFILLFIFRAQGQENETLAMNAGDAIADGVYYDAVKANILGDSKLADSLFMVFAKAKPDVAATYYELSKLSIKQSKEEEAVNYIEKAIKLDPGNKWYKMQYAEILAASNEFEQAADLYHEIADKEENNVDYLFKAASYYKLAGKFKEALTLLDKLMLQDAGDEDILIQKQQIYLKMNDLDKAAGVIKQLINQNPKEPKYYAWLADMYDNNKQTAKAEEVLNKAEQLFPDEASIQLSLAEHYKKLNDTVRSNEYVKKAITNKDLDPETQIQLLVPYLQDISNDSVRRIEGMELARKLYEEHTKDAMVIAVYGDALSMNDQHDSAVIEFKQSLAIDPSRFAVWEKLFETYSDRKDADSLVKYTEKAMRLFPNQALVYFYNGIAQMNLKNYQAAIKSLNRAIDTDPDDDHQNLANMYGALGDIYNTTKQFPLSDSCFTKAIALSPNDPFVLNNYSYFLSVRGEKLDEAEKMSQRSLELRPEASFFDTYGWILFKKGQYEKAKEYIQKAIDSNPVNADGTLFEHMGDVLYKMNDIDNAVEDWKKAKEKGVNDPQLDKKIRERKLYE